MPTHRTISAKRLGALAMPDACARCSWVQLHAKGRLPYQIFPGIFSSIDKFSKEAVHAWFDANDGAPPEWLSELGGVNGYIEPPHWSKFKRLHEPTAIIVRGEADGIFRKDDRSYHIVDYKTAKFTEGQDALRPMYEAQLNAYAWIGGANGVSPVSQLSLIYMEPVTSPDITGAETAHWESGIVLPFEVHIEAIDVRPALLEPLLKRARSLFDAKTAPERTDGCADCENLDAIVALIDNGA